MDSSERDKMFSSMPFHVSHEEEGACCPWGEAQWKAEGMLTP